MTWQLAWLTVACCLAMVGADFFGTRLTQSVANGHPKMAGLCDVGSDFFGRVVLTSYGFESLTHGHGVAGWICCIPVLATGYYTTYRVAKDRRGVEDAVQAQLVAWARTQGFQPIGE